MIDTNDIKDKSDFLEFLQELQKKQSNGEWENNTIEDFLEAMSSWIEDMEGYYLNLGQKKQQDISWKVFADILMASSMYE